MSSNEELANLLIRVGIHGLRFLLSPFFIKYVYKPLHRLSKAHIPATLSYSCLLCHTRQFNCLEKNSTMFGRQGMGEVVSVRCSHQDRVPMLVSG